VCFRKEPPGRIRHLSRYQRRYLSSKRKLTSGGVNVDIDALPGLTSASPSDATHGEAQCALGFDTTTGQQCFAGAPLEMTALAITFHEVVRAFARSGPIRREFQVAVCALKIARIRIGTKSMGVIGVSALRVREGFDLQEMVSECTDPMSMLRVGAHHA